MSSPGDPLSQAAMQQVLMGEMAKRQQFKGVGVIPGAPQFTQPVATMISTSEGQVLAVAGGVLLKVEVFLKFAVALAVREAADTVRDDAELMDRAWSLADAWFAKLNAEEVKQIEAAKKNRSNGHR